MTSPRITVVTPVYNGADHLLATIRSVQHQTMSELELIVVDDGSVDGSADIVRGAAERDPRIKLVEQPNAGLSAARNAGARHAHPQAEFLLFLDDDDLLRPRALELLADALRRVPDATAAHGSVAAVDADGSAVPLVRGEAAERRTIVDPHRWWTSRRATRTLADAEPSRFEAFGYVLFVYTVGQVLLRRGRFAAIGDFDPMLRVAQDYDMWLRISARGAIEFVPAVVLDYRQTASSLSSDQATTRREDLYVRFKAITDRELPSETRAMARHLHRHHEWHRAADRVVLLRSAVRRRNTGDALREVVRISRSTAEALLALTPWTWTYDLRVRRFQRAAARS